MNDPTTGFSKTLSILDYVLTAIFAEEMILKLIANGILFCGSRSYLRSSTNIFDTVIVMITIFSYFVAQDLNSIKVLRLIKVLRPLRAISRNQGLRASIQTLVVAIPSILDICLVMMLYLFIVSIISINYFKGQLYLCENQVLESLQNKWDCINSGGDWKNSNLNFDNVPEAMATVFVLSNSVDWSKIMFHAAKAQGKDLMPTYGQDIPSPLVSLFIVAVVMLGNFFIMNLFIGVLISKYNREKELLGKDFMLTESQKKWVKNRMNILQSQPIFRFKEPNEGWRGAFYFVA